MLNKCWNPMLSCIINISFSSTHIERFQTVILLICLHLPEFLHGPTLHLSRKTLLRAGKIINANFKNIPTVVCFSGYLLNDLQNGMFSLLLGQYLFTNNTMSGNFISCTEMVTPKLQMQTRMRKYIFSASHPSRFITLQQRFSSTKTFLRRWRDLLKCDEERNEKTALQITTLFDSTLSQSTDIMNFKNYLKSKTSEKNITPAKQFWSWVLPISWDHDCCTAKPCAVKGQLLLHKLYQKAGKVEVHRKINTQRHF